MLATILLIDPNLHDIDSNQKLLIQQGYGVLWARSAFEGFHILDTNKVDLIILDIHLPDISGFECAQYIKNKYKIIMTFYTSCNDSEKLVKGLEIAEDYIIKTCSEKEFLARIRMLLRRSTRPVCQAILPPMKVDYIKRNVLVNGLNIELTPIEFSIVSLLASAPNVPIPFDVINQVIWGYPQSTNNQVIMVHMSNIRKKIMSAAQKSFQIKSVGAKGYMLKYSPI